MATQRAEPESLKRPFDLVVATALALVLLPVAALVALVVMLERRGPVLFRQERLGRDRGLFQILKFRSMEHDAERATGPVWATPRDPRITPVGRFLRASHLDELPQLWNVLRGEMSLVGPRPERGHFVAQLESVVPGYAERFAARPGITGLSQIRSGYDESLRTVRRKTRYDRFYIRRSCVHLDLWLLMGTLGHLSLATGAACGRREHGWKTWRPLAPRSIVDRGPILTLETAPMTGSLESRPLLPAPAATFVVE